jgi:sensor domain DACNV-containing protein
MAKFPPDLGDQLWIEYQGLQRHYQNQPHVVGRFSEQQLKNLIYAVYEASLKTDEGRPVCFKVHLCSDRSTLVATKFGKPQDCSASNFVKLSPTVGMGPKWITVLAQGNGSLNIIGFSDPEVTNANTQNLWEHGFLTNQVKLDGLKIWAYGPGHIRIGTVTGHVFELRDAKISRPARVNDKIQVRNWYTRFANSDPVREAAIQIFWSRILVKVRDAAHGGCFIVLRTTNTTRNLRIKYRIAPNTSERLAKAVDKRVDLNRLVAGINSNTLQLQNGTLFDLCNSHFVERTTARVCDLVASLAAVDGAVVLRENLKILGFGAEISLTQPPVSSEMISYWDRRNVEVPAVGVGMRHRTAFRFCKSRIGAMAFVVSQDGGITLFVNQGQGRCIGYKNLVPEVWDEQ